MKYRIKEILYASGRKEYVIQKKGIPETKSDIIKMLRLCIIIYPAFFVIPYFIYVGLFWRTETEDTGIFSDEESAQNWICRQKKIDEEMKDNNRKATLNKTKRQSRIVPLKDCDP